MTTANDNGGSDKIRLFKAILNSQVGGWIAACLVFAFVARWVSNDRNLVYQDLWRLRKEAIDQLTEMKAILYENNQLAKQIMAKLDWGNRQHATQPIPYGVLEIPTSPQPQGRAPEKNDESNQ
jgi:hypothetical protein